MLFEDYQHRTEPLCDVQLLIHPTVIYGLSTICQALGEGPFNLSSKKMTLLRIKQGKQPSTVHKKKQEEQPPCALRTQKLIQPEENLEHARLNLMSPFPSTTQRSGTRGTSVNAIHAYL